MLLKELKILNENFESITENQIFIVGMPNWICSSMNAKVWMFLKNSYFDKVKYVSSSINNQYSWQ